MKNTEKKVTTPKVAGAPPSITDEEIQTCLDHVQAIATVLAPYAITLTAAGRRSQTKYRKEGDTVIPILARLATASGLASTALDVDAMQKKADLVTKLQPLHTTVKALSDTIGDTVLSAKGDAWNTATTLHGALVRVSKRNPKLRRDMEAVKGAFSLRKKATAESAASPPATENAAATPAEPSAPQAQPATVSPAKAT